MNTFEQLIAGDRSLSDNFRRIFGEDNSKAAYQADIEHDRRKDERLEAEYAVKSTGGQA